MNLLSVAETARDETTRQRLMVLEKELRDTEELLARFANTTERNHKLLAPLDRFEVWAASQRPYLYGHAGGQTDSMAHFECDRYSLVQ